MKFIEVLVLFGTGYVCGLSITSGFMFQAIRKFNQGYWSRAREVVWLLVASANILVGSITPILLIALTVIEDKPDRLDVWPRLGLFALGALAGAVLVFFGFAQINKGVRQMLAKGTGDSLKTYGGGRKT